MNQSFLHQSYLHSLCKKREKVHEYPIMVTKLHIFSCQYISVLFIILLDIILLSSNIIICLTPMLLFLVNSTQINHVLVSILIHSIYPLLTFLNESIFASHFLFIFKSINYEVLLFYLLLEHPVI